MEETNLERGDFGISNFGILDLGGLLGETDGEDGRGIGDWNDRRSEQGEVEEGEEGEEGGVSASSSLYTMLRFTLWRAPLEEKGNEIMHTSET